MIPRYEDLDIKNKPVGVKTLKTIDLHEIRTIIYNQTPYLDPERSIVDYINKEIVDRGISFHYLIHPDRKIYNLISLDKGSFSFHTADYSPKAIDFFGKEYCPSVNEVRKGFSDGVDNPNNLALTVGVISDVKDKLSTGLSDEYSYFCGQFIAQLMLHVNLEMEDFNYLFSVPEIREIYNVDYEDSFINHPNWRLSAKLYMRRCYEELVNQ